MNEETKDDPFCQSVTFDLHLDRIVEAGEINRILKSIGFTLFYDVYAMIHEEEVPDWQSDSYVSIEMYLGSKEVDAQDSCDRLRLTYLMASIDSKYIEPFADVVGKIQSKLGGRLCFNEQEINVTEIVPKLTKCATFLMTEWGEEPGSESLQILIETW